jgi:type IV pilus assembly protein PilA
VEKEVEGTAAGAFITCAGCQHRFHLPMELKAGASSPLNIVLIVLVSAAAVPVVVAIIGILAAIAIPNFIKFQARSKQSECKTNLKRLADSERAYFLERQRFTSELSEVGFTVERGNRYAYFAGPGTQEERTQAKVVSSPTDTQIGVDQFRIGGEPITERDLPAGLVPGVSGACPDCAFLAVCLGRVDNDATLDVWSVSTVERRSASGEVIPAGVPFNDLNDVSE